LSALFWSMRLGTSVLVLGVLFLGGWFWFDREEISRSEELLSKTSDVAETIIQTEEKPEIIVEPKVAVLIASVVHLVPFTSQAPTGDWSQSAFQDGCEEASTMMVWMAKTGKKLTRDEVRVKLLDMAAFQTKLIGHGVDTDTADTHEYLLKQYFELAETQVVYDFDLDELKEAVMGGLVIVPTNGRALGNPNFTAPGPLQHMLVIKGYDMTIKEFITNDPGTRKGEGYRYPEEILYAAIREYPTGKHLSITTQRKAMLVVPIGS
jgi:hypothetical protein